MHRLPHSGISLSMRLTPPKREQGPNQGRKERCRDGPPQPWRGSPAIPRRQPAPGGAAAPETWADLRSLDLRPRSPVGGPMPCRRISHTGGGGNYLPRGVQQPLRDGRQRVERMIDLCAICRRSATAGSRCERSFARFSRRSVCCSISPRCSRAGRIQVVAITRLGCKCAESWKPD